MAGRRYDLVRSAPMDTQNALSGEVVALPGLELGQNFRSDAGVVGSRHAKLDGSIRNQFEEVVRFSDRMVVRFPVLAIGQDETAACVSRMRVKWLEEIVVPVVARTVDRMVLGVESTIVSHVHDRNPSVILRECDVG